MFCMRTLTPVFGLLIALGLYGCHQARHPHDLDRLLIGETIANAELAPNLRVLSMPGGRLSGTPNAEKAEEFVAEKLREYGLTNVHFEPFEMSCWTSYETQVTIEGDPPQEVAGALVLARTISTPADGITANVIDVGKGTAEDYAAHADELAGCFALVRDGRPRSDKIRFAIEHDAAGVLIMASANRPPYIGNGHSEPRREPVVLIPHDEQLLDKLAAGEAVSVNVKYTTRNWDCEPRNVVGEIPGHGLLSHEVIIIGAHLDSWHLAEGAIDNGNGSATILEVARVLSTVDWKPRRTIRFVWFMAEELGLVGSHAYVDAHLHELDRVVAMINLDMPGEPRRLAYFGDHAEVEPLLKQIVDDLPGYEMLPEIRRYQWTGSDHAPFVEQGVCALTLSGELGPGVKNYHTAGDTYEIVDTRGTLHSAAVVAILARRLADAPERPTVRHIPDADDAK